jgi:hypothetical protein
LQKQQQKDGLQQSKLQETCQDSFRLHVIEHIPITARFCLSIWIIYLWLGTSRSLNHHPELMPVSYGWLSSLGNMERMKTDAMGAHKSV